MGISDTTKIDSAFKFIHGKGYTTSQKQLDNEDAYGGFVLGSDSIFMENGSIPGTPPGTSTAILAFSNPFTMIQDISSPTGLAWYASTNGSTLTNMRNTRQGNWVSSQFGQGYTIVIHAYNGGVQGPQIFFSDATGPIFDYKTGILTFESNPLAAYPGNDGIRIIGYRYVGTLLNNKFNADGYLISAISDAYSGTALAVFNSLDGLVVEGPTGSTYSLFVSGDQFNTGNIFAINVQATNTVTASTFTGYPVSTMNIGTGVSNLNILMGAAASNLTIDSQMIINANTDATSNVPMTQWLDSDGYVRALVDHNGFLLGGRWSFFDEQWITGSAALKGTTPFSQPDRTWFYVTAANPHAGDLALRNPTTDQTFMATHFTTIADAASHVHLQQRGYQFYPDANAIYIAEWEAWIESPDNHINAFMGWEGLANASPGAATLGFHIAAGGSGNWVANSISSGSSSNSVDTGVAFNTATTAGTRQRFRLEYHGQNTARGAGVVGGKAYFFINDNLTNTISPQKLDVASGFYIGIANDGASTAELLVGPIRIQWTRYLTNPAL